MPISVLCAADTPGKARSGSDGMSLGHKQPRPSSGNYVRVKAATSHDIFWAAVRDQSVVANGHIKERRQRASAEHETSSLHVQS